MTKPTGLLQGLKVASIHLVPTLAYVAAGLLFLAPLVTLDYQGERLTTCSGLDLAKATFADEQAVRNFCLNSPKLKPYVEQPAADFEPSWQRAYRALAKALSDAPADANGPQWQAAYAELARAAQEPLKDDLIIDKPPKALTDLMAALPPGGPEADQAKFLESLKKLVKDYPPGEPTPAWKKVQAAFQGFADSSRVWAWMLPICLLVGLLGLAGRIWPPQKLFTPKIHLVAGIVAGACIIIILGESTLLAAWPCVSFQWQFFAMLGACAAATASAAVSILTSLSRQQEYQVGTLRYSTFGLACLFMTLLWGALIFNLMEAVLPNVLPFLLTDLGASGTTLQLLNKTMAYLLAFFMGPIIGFRSDRYRSRLGRRIPFLLWTTPFLVAFLVLMGFYKEISGALVGADGSFLGMGTTTMYVLVIAVLLVGFDFFNMFATSIYYYLFNDVVPKQFFSRFMSLFWIIGGLGGAAFNKWIFPITLAKTPILLGIDNFKLVTTSSGILYLVIFMGMCFLIKEGQYPPPSPEDAKRKGFVENVKTYARECFTCRFYWFFFLTCIFMRLSSVADTFLNLRNWDSLGLTIPQIGELGFWGLLVGMLLQYPAGVLADRYSRTKIYVMVNVALSFQTFLQLIWLFADFGPKWNYYGQLIIYLAMQPFGALYDATEIPMGMSIYPRERYGQFASANSMLRCFAMSVGAIICGLFMDAMVKGFPSLHIPPLGAWGYRYAAVWGTVWRIPMLVCLYKLYRKFQELGGDKGFKPPAV